MNKTKTVDKNTSVRNQVSRISRDVNVYGCESRNIVIDVKSVFTPHCVRRELLGTVTSEAAVQTTRQ